MWMVAHPELWAQPIQVIAKRLVEEKLCSLTTAIVDIHIDSLITEARAWIAEHPEEATQIVAKKIGMVGAQYSQDQKNGHNDAARKLYSLCCSAPVAPIYRLNGIELDGFECAVCQNRLEKVGCVPSFYETSQGKA